MSTKVAKRKEWIKRLINLVRLQFGEIDELSFLLGYYTAQGSRHCLINTLKCHDEHLGDTAEKMFLEDLNNLRMMISELCNERGCHIPEWLQIAVGKESDG
jgi:hypothetical protein